MVATHGGGALAHDQRGVPGITVARQTNQRRVGYAAGTPRLAVAARFVRG